MNDCFEMFSNYCSLGTGYLSTREKDSLLNFACLGFLCETSLIDMFSVDLLPLKCPVS